MDYENLQSKDYEILSVEDEKIRRMIGDLKRVDAPKDFDFRLKARIAKAASSDFQPRLFPALRYVLPLSVAAFIFAFIILNGAYFADKQSAPVVAGAFPPAPQTRFSPSADLAAAPPDAGANVAQVEPEKSESVKVSGQINASPKNKRITIVNENQFVAVKSEKKNPVVLPKAVEREESVGTRVSASTSTKIITPAGIDLNKTAETSTAVENQASLSVEQALFQLGIETVSENGKLKVKAVREKSVGETSGVKAGDMIEAIDGAKISDALINSKKVEVKRITVLRGSEEKVISLHN